MTNLSSVSIRSSGSRLVTDGLARLGHAELALQVRDPGIIPEGEELLQYLAGYLRTGQERLRDGETISYGYWLLKVRSTAEGILEILERTPDGDSFVVGASQALSYWRDQHRICEEAGAIFTPPRPDVLAAVAKGVMDGEPVEGVRYPSPQHMSGWWFFTDRYKGDINTVKTEHLYHVTAARADLAPFIALPAGYRFSQKADSRMWFDPAVASEPPE